MPIDNDFFKSAFSVDNVIFGFDKRALKVLMIKRGDEPFKGKWAMPGDLVYPTEDLNEAPRRVLKELTGLDNVFLEQVYTFGKVNRHPVGRVITVAYYALVNINMVNPKAASFANEVAWLSVDEINTLAFDHLTIMQRCLSQLKQSVRMRPIGFELLKKKFTLSELQNLYEAVLDKELDKRNFRKKIISMGILTDKLEYQQGVAHRPAKLYQFDRERYELAKKQGFNFEV